MEINNSELDAIYDKFIKCKHSAGLEFHPFCIGWYNESVGERFKLPFSENTLGYSIVSTPSFFEEQFITFIKDVDFNSLKDPLDQCLTLVLEGLKNQFDEDIKIIHDFEIHPNRRPKVLVQSAGHVSGAAYYYQKHDVVDPPWTEDKKIFGVSSHSKYGGWFSFRGVFIFPDVQTPFLKMVPPSNKLSNEEKIELLDQFNFHWQNWKYREIGNPTDRYCERQKEYFLTKPTERFDLIKSYKLKP